MFLRSWVRNLKVLFTDMIVQREDCYISVRYVLESRGISRICERTMLKIERSLKDWEHRFHKGRLFNALLNGILNPGVGGTYFGWLGIEMISNFVPCSCIYFIGQTSCCITFLSVPHTLIHISDQTFAQYKKSMALVRSSTLIVLARDWRKSADSLRLYAMNAVVAMG